MIKFNDKEFDNSFGDVVYPFFTYNGNVDTSKLDNFEYYQLIIYSESYSEPFLLIITVESSYFFVVINISLNAGCAI